MKYIFSILIIVLLVGCASNQNTEYEEWPPACCKKRILPPGNVNKVDETVNTEGNEIAPVQRPLVKDENYEICNRNKNSEEQGKADGIKPSNYYVQNELRVINKADSGLKRQAYEYLTDYIESITFLDRTRGFISFSHPLTNEFAAAVGLNLDGIKGGTDIFEFELSSPNSFSFKNLNPVGNVNSEFWDSHPHSFYREFDGVMYTILLYASDSEKPYTRGEPRNSKDSIIRMGHSDIYYVSRNELNGVWSEPRKLDPGINQNNAFEGSPFIYCNCLNPHLFFSSNRNDDTPFDIEKKFKENFDLFFVPISLNLINGEIVITSVADVEPFKNQNEFVFFDNEAKPDSSINTNKDERFPYVPDPSENSDENFIYFSSNRNMKLAEYGPTDSLVKNVGNYDIYRFALDIPCEKREDKFDLHVYVKDACTGEDIPDAQVVLKHGATQRKSTTGVLPAVFDSLDRNIQYKVFGGSKYKSVDEDYCGDVDTVYYKAPDKEYIFKANIPDETIYINDLYSMEEYNNKIEKVWYDTTKVTKYINTYEFNGVAINKYQIHESDYTGKDDNRFKVKIKVDKSYKLKPNKGLKAVCDEVDKSTVSSVKAIGVKSEKTKNNGLYAKSLTSTVIKDTVYLIPRETQINCITLNVNLNDICPPGDPVRNPVIKFVEYDPESDTETIVKNGLVNKDNLKMELFAGKIYRIYGGSEFMYNSDCPELLYYIDANATEVCPVEISNLEDKPFSEEEIAKGANIQSGIFEIDTRGFDKDTTIYDIIEVKSVKFKKPKCETYFTELQDEMHRRVPYFQTAFWEVNTPSNLRYIYPKLNNDNRTYGDPYTIKSGEYLNCNICPEVSESGNFWPGAKWIELHENNSSYGSESQREYKHTYYQRKARVVQDNLNFMMDYMSNSLLPAYEIIQMVNEYNDLDQDSKFIIRVEAWSDFRPVCYGWYISKKKSEDVIRYAQCDNIYNIDSESPRFNFAEVKDGDHLGCENQTLSKLRAYFAYMEVFKMMSKYESFEPYLAGGPDSDNVLLPHELINSDGTMMNEAQIREQIKNHKIIVLTKGFSTEPKTNKPWYWPDYTETPSTKSGLQSLEVSVSDEAKSEVRTIQVFVKVKKYTESGEFKDDCCEPSDKPNM